MSLTPQDMQQVVQDLVNNNPISVLKPISNEERREIDVRVGDERAHKLCLTQPFTPESMIAIANESFERRLPKWIEMTEQTIRLQAAQGNLFVKVPYHGLDEYADGQAGRRCFV